MRVGAWAHAVAKTEPPWHVARHLGLAVPASFRSSLNSTLFLPLIPGGVSIVLPSSITICGFALVTDKAGRAICWTGLVGAARLLVCVHGTGFCSAG